jgi:hypothetical protein
LEHNVEELQMFQFQIHLQNLFKNKN